jgi:cyclopropane fatty-acyl-phospholipid synthase-like methyltransferase
MTDTATKVREHYSPTDLTNRVKSALATITDESQTLSVAQLAPFDQFHTRGILATAELAAAAGLEPSIRVLDLGCSIGGPARYLAATFGCKVTGVDLSPSCHAALESRTSSSLFSRIFRYLAGTLLHLNTGILYLNPGRTLS